MDFDRDKFKRFFHYIVWKASDPAKLGAVKLNKILWFSDAKAYVLHGRPITGEIYIRRQYGPMSQHYYEVREELQLEGSIRYWRAPLYSVTQDVFRADRAPDMSGFSAEEMLIIDYWIRHVTEQHTAKSIGDESHDYGWEIAKMGERLPYFAILAERGREPRGDELAWAQEVVCRRKLP
jgi:hypothetical protein